MKNLTGFIVAIVVLIFMCDVAKYPECYITTEKYQLQNAIKKGDKAAIEYYNNNYVANGRILFK